MVVPNISEKERVLKLIEEKEKLERKIQDLGLCLRLNHVGMWEPLIDDSGFPRTDIDVYQVRHARHQILCLQNDLKYLMEDIDRGLGIIHSEAAVNDDVNKELHVDRILLISEQLNVPIVKVNHVHPNSPSEEAGLLEGDEIIEFGTVNNINFKDLKQISDLVQNRKNQKISLKIKRDNVIRDITLTPKEWSGRGVLGCSIVSNDSVDR